MATFVKPDDSLTKEYFIGTVAFEVLEHLKDPEAFLDRAALGNHLVVSTPIVPTMAWNPHHKHDFTLEQFRSMIEKRFQIVSEWHQLQPFQKEPCYAVIHGVSRLCP